MKTINEDFKKINNEVINRRGYIKTVNYKKPKNPDFARFKMEITFKDNKSKYWYFSLEQLTLKQMQCLDEWSSFKKLIAWKNKLLTQGKLEFAKIYLSLSEIPLIKEKKHDYLVAIFTPHHEIVNSSLRFEIKNEDHIVKRDIFVKEWLD